MDFTFHTDYFIREYLFSIRLSAFKNRHFSLSIDIFIMSVCQVLAEFWFIFVTPFKQIFAETKVAESAPCIFVLFYKSTMFC